MCHPGLISHHSHPCMMTEIIYTGAKRLYIISDDDEIE